MTDIADPANLPERQLRDPNGDPVGRPLPGWTGVERPARVTLDGVLTRAQPLSETHAQVLHEAYAGDADGRLWTYMAHGPFADLPAFAGWVGRAAGQPDPLFYFLARRDGSPVGVAALMRIQPEIGVIEIGSITITPDARRSRAATEALFLLMRYAMDDLGYRRLEWKCDALNAPSRQAALRLGFRFEGIFRNATIYKGRNRDTAWFAITDEEWPACRQALQAWLDDANFDADGRQRRRLADLRRN
ncbi:MAG: GNAT family N-acetyltransferase [Alphaproteobacteria bacterium]